MSETGSNELALGRDGVSDAQNLPGIIATLAVLHPNAIVTEEGVAHLFGRHVVSVKRAVERGELPPPCSSIRGKGLDCWYTHTPYRTKA